MFFSFCEAWHILSILRIRRGIPRAYLTLIYQHAMARIAASSEACRSAWCTIYTSRGEAALPQVYSRLYECDFHNFICHFLLIWTSTFVVFHCSHGCSSQFSWQFVPCILSGMLRCALFLSSPFCILYRCLVHVWAYFQQSRRCMSPATPKQISRTKSIS